VKIPSNIITLIIGIAITLISLWYGQNHGLMPVAASTDATQVDSIFNLMMTIATGLFLIVEGVIIYCVIKFRRKPGDQTDGPAIEGNVPLEILWTAIPTIIVFVLATYSFEVYNNLGGLDPVTSRDAAPQQVAMAGHHGQMALGIGPALDENKGVKPLVVNVKGIQYAWIFTYPDTGIISGELHVPKDQPVQLNMEGGDVIHAFWVPQLRLKQDVIPGRETVLAFAANREGSYPVICAELCGAYHGGMKAMMYVDSPDAYQEWVKANAPAQEAGDEIALVNPSQLSDGEYLAPYAHEMGMPQSVSSEQLSLVGAGLAD
jgi:cytochrome c oxidase subunit 2